MPTLEEHADAVIGGFEIYAQKLIDAYTKGPHQDALYKLDAVSAKLYKGLERTAERARREAVRIATHDWIDYSEALRPRKRVSLLSYLEE